MRLGPSARVPPRRPAHLAEASRAAVDPHQDWPERVRAQLAAALGCFAANPDLARFYLIAPPRAGAQITARYRLAVSRVIAALTEGTPADLAEPSQAVQNALGGGMVRWSCARCRRGRGSGSQSYSPT